MKQTRAERMALNFDGIDALVIANASEPFLDSTYWYLTGCTSGTFEAVATCGNVPMLRWRDEAVLGVVMASKGYPGSYTKGSPITVAPDFNERIYHMGTKRTDEGLATAGGRVLMVVAAAPTTAEASRCAYAGVSKIHCDNLFYRKDIAKFVL